LLAFQATAVAGEAARGAHDAMAGHDDADWVPAVGQSYGPGSGWLSDPVGELAVGDRLTVGNVLQRGPDTALERGAVQGHRQVEPGALPGEVLPELMERRIEQRGVGLPERLGCGPVPLLFVRSVFVLVLVQVIFFDFEHRLILDRVMFPSMALALVVSLFGHPWWAGIATGVGAGLIFLLIALAGAAIFKAEALGFGDVKLAVFMGLLLGPLPTAQAMFYGVFLAGLVSIGFIAWHRSLKGTIAYGPYLAAGALIVLFLLPA